MHSEGDMVRRARLFGVGLLWALTVTAPGCGGKATKSSVGSGGAGGSGSGGLGSNSSGSAATASSTASGGAGGSGAGGRGAAGSGGSGAAGASAKAAGTPTPSGGTIRNGVCYPPAGPTRDDLGAKVHVLVQAAGLLFGPVVDATGVYYSVERDGLYRIPPGSDTPALIVATPMQRYTPSISGKYLYYEISDPRQITMRGPVERLPLSDLKAKPERVIDTAPDHYAADASYIYVADSKMHTIYRQSIGGGAQTVLLPKVDATLLTLGDDGFLYYSWSPSDDVISRIPLAGGTVEDVVTASILTLSWFVVSTDGIYFSDYNGLFFTAFGQPKQRKTFAVNFTGVGQAPKHLALSVEKDRLYWVLDDFPSGSVGWTKLDLSDCGTVIDGGQDFHSAAIGADGVYIGTFSTTSELYRVPRP
jgi:hypothetical protein